MDDRKLMLVLGFPVSVNHYWLSHGKVRYISPKGRAFRQHVIDTMPVGWEPFTDRLQVFMEVYPPDRRARDLDNLLKSTFDSLEHAKAYLNDSQIDKITVVRKNVIPRYGKVIITIETLCA